MILSEVSVRRPVFTTVMMLALMVFGIWSYSKVGVDLFPEVEFPVVTVVAVYPGADPESVESKVVDILEEAINSVSGIEELRSTSTENVGMVIVQFELSRDADQAVQDVRDKVASVIGQLPTDLEAPVIQKFDIGAAPIMSLVVSAPMSTRELTALAEDTIKQRLQTITGVGNIDVVGGQVREFEILVNPVQLQSFGIAVEDVARAVGAQNIAIPGGRLEFDGLEYSLKTQGEVHSAEELGRLVVANSGGRAILVSDVAEVIDGVEEKRSHASLNGQTAVSLTIQKQSGANTVEVAERVRTELDRMKSELGEDVTITIPVDNSIFIEQSISGVEFDLVFGAILAVLIIMLFLRDWRATFIAALALPISVVATIAFIYAMGFTFNTMTMLALTLSIGILIDDAIVVIENIHRHLSMGKTAVQAALDGTAEIGLAVLAITASIVAVFVPVATMKGIIGRFFFQFGLTVAFAVSVSLFVAFTLTPMMSSKMLKHDEERRTRLGQAVENLMIKMDNMYGSVVRVALRHPLVTIVIAVGSFVAAMGLFRVIPFEFMPSEDRGEFNVFVELPSGTPLAETMDYVEEITQVVRETPGVEMTFATIGGGTQGEVNKGMVFVDMVGSKERTFSQKDAMEYVRGKLASFDKAVIAIEPVGGIGGGGNTRQGDLQYLLLGQDYGELDKAADALVARLQEIDGFVDVDKSSRAGKPEMQIVIDRQRAADLNVPVASIGMAIRTLYSGDKISEIATDGDRFDARIRMLESFRDDPSKILDLMVRSNTGALVSLSNLVRVDMGLGPTQIERFNRSRQITVLANLKGLALGDAVQIVEEIAPTVLPEGVRGEMSGMADSMQESVKYMGEAMILAIVLILLILAAQFESFLHPMTILLALPLSLVGALGGLAITGMSLNMFTMIGFIMLFGLATKNAVLLVDYTNVLRRDHGMDIFEALVEAGIVRLRPILMTTAAMIFGMAPVAMALHEGGEARAPMAVAVIGGLITSTVLTLVVVPVAYLLLDKIVHFVSGGKMGGDTYHQVEEAPAGEHPETNGAV